MIFKLDENQGTYICSEEEGEIILPCDKSEVLKVEEIQKT